jgi:hypothetical protein
MSSILADLCAQMREEGGNHRVSANEYSCTLGAQINVGDRTPFLTYDSDPGSNRLNVFERIQMQHYDYIPPRFSAVPLVDRAHVTSMSYSPLLGGFTIVLRYAFRSKE